MATKKSTVKDALKEEFQSSFGVDASVPDPVVAGDTHAGRAADQVTAPDPEPTAYVEGQPGTTPPTPRTEMLAHLFDRLRGMDEVQLGGMYAELAQLGGIGGDAHAGRTADQSTTATEPASYAGVREDVKLVLKNTNLDEETVDRATKLFEAAVEARIIEATVELEGQFADRLQEEVDLKCGELEEQNAQYMNRIAEEWYADNQITIDSGIRTELAESFIEGLKDLFEKHYIEIPEDRVDVVEKLAEEVQALRTKLDEAEDQLIRQHADEQEAEALRESIVEELSEGLTELQKDRLQQIVETVDFDTSRVDDFKELVQTLREDFVVRPAKLGNAESMLNEEIIVEGEAVEEVDADPAILRLAKEVGRFGSRAI